MADAPKKDAKKDAKKEAPAPSIWSDYAPVWVILGGAFFVSMFLTNWNGVFFDINREEGKQGISFPTGNITKRSEVVNKEVALVRTAPGGTLLGKQDRFEKAKVVQGPISAYGKEWWNLDYENAPDGWVLESSVTVYVGLYLGLNIIPISWGYVKIFLWIITAFLIGMIVYAKSKLEAAQDEAARKLSQGSVETVPHIVIDSGENAVPVEKPTPQSEREGNTRWAHVLQLLGSYNQSDWRQSIIEADIILEEMLEKMGYEGQSIGDKLKNVESSDFLTINQAWEAHKVRNKIAHMGSDYKVGQDEAKKVIALYQEVFEEFYFV